MLDYGLKGPAASRESRPLGRAGLVLLDQSLLYRQEDRTLDLIGEAPFSRTFDPADGGTLQPSQRPAAKGPHHNYRRSQDRDERSEQRPSEPDKRFLRIGVWPYPDVQQVGQAIKKDASPRGGIALRNLVPWCEKTPEKGRLH